MFDFPPLFIIDSSMLHSIIRHLAYSELLRAILGQGAGQGAGLSGIAPVSLNAARCGGCGGRS